MRAISFGHVLFIFGIAGIGALNLLASDFAFQWQPVPKGIPGRELLAMASGIFLITCCIGTFFKRYAACFALALGIYLLVWLFLLKSPAVIAAPLEVLPWLGFTESLALLSGGWILFVSATQGHALGRLFFAGDRDVRFARFLFGVSCLVFGLAHFAYPGFTAGMVPAWLPDRVGFAYLTGAGHIAAGLGIMLMVLPRLAATLESLMMSSFALLVHIPGVIKEPGSRLQWTMLFVACALAGAGWLVARSFGNLPWNSVKRPAAGAVQK